MDEQVCGQTDVDTGAVLHPLGLKLQQLHLLEAHNGI